MRPLPLPCVGAALGWGGCGEHWEGRTGRDQQGTFPARPGPASCSSDLDDEVIQ